MQPTAPRGPIIALALALALASAGAVQAQSPAPAAAVSATSEEAGTPGRPPVLPVSGSHRLVVGGAGFLVGAGVTFLVLNHGGSTAPCDRSANQDAWSRGGCLGAYALGGIVGAGLGLMAARLLGADRRQAIPLEGLRLGIAPDGSRRVGFRLRL